jgi:hypothetical protein
VKNDERDAADLAHLLRMGRLPEAWIAPPATRELRELVRHRAKLVALRSGIKASVHAVLAKCGVNVRPERVATPHSYVVDREYGASSAVGQLLGSQAGSDAGATRPPAAELAGHGGISPEAAGRRPCSGPPTCE